MLVMVLVGGVCYGKKIWNEDSAVRFKCVYDSLELKQLYSYFNYLPKNENKAYTITIRTQSKFNKLTSLIESALDLIQLLCY